MHAIAHNKMRHRILLVLSLPLTVLIILSGLVGLQTPGFYAAESPNWQAQSIGQDMVNVFLIAPCLLIASIFVQRNNSNAKLVWAGTVLYLIYTFVIYCFDVHFNKLFFIYCLCLGLSFYAFVYFLFTHYNEYRSMTIASKGFIRFTGSYFIVISLVFYFLWLAEIIPSVLQNTTPKTVTEAGLFTNAVHVIDLAVMLPAIFITGIFLIEKKTLGFILAPILLTFFVLMNLTIGMLMIMMKRKGLEADLFLSLIMGLLATTSLALLIGFLRRMKTTAGS